MNIFDIIIVSLFCLALIPFILIGLTCTVCYLISRWWFWLGLFIILSLIVPKAHSQEIPLEQYVQQYFKEKAARQAFEARLPKPKPAPIPELPPYPNILAPYHAPSLLDSVPRRDYEPLYIRPGIVPPLPSPTPFPRKAKPLRSPSPETLYVGK